MIVIKSRIFKRVNLYFIFIKYYIIFFFMVSFVNGGKWYNINVCESIIF